MFGLNKRDCVLNYQRITTNNDLKTVCENARKVPYIALDTEFIRIRTYYPKLGLIQLYDGVTVSLIDPLEITEWQPFIELLQDVKVEKLLHAGSEDLEVFLNEFGTMPTPMMDTQILAAFTGKPISSGFAALVSEYQGIELDKSEARTDWLARPLTEKQCAYAAADVFYLLPLAKQLLNATEQAGWLEAAKSECELLCQKRREFLKPENAYLEIKNAWQLNRRQLGCLRLLASWRLEQARERDLAVNFVIREESLWQVARYSPNAMAELNKLGLSQPEIRFHGKRVLELVKKAQELPESDLPTEIVRVVDHHGYKFAFKELKALIQTVAEEKALNVELVASRRQINQLLQWHWKVTPDAEPELLQYWRGHLLKTQLLENLKQYK